MGSQGMKKMIQLDSFEEYKRAIQKNDDRIGRGSDSMQLMSCCIPNGSKPRKSLGSSPGITFPEFPMRPISPRKKSARKARAKREAEKKAKEERKRPRNSPAPSQQLWWFLFRELPKR